MQQNDPLHQLYVEHYSYLYRFARSFVNPDLAEDLVQETFLIAQKRLDRVTSSENPTGWLINTLKNVIGNTYQKRQFIYTELSPDAIADEAGEYVHSINDMYAGLIDDEALDFYGVTEVVAPRWIPDGFTPRIVAVKPNGTWLEFLAGYTNKSGQLLAVSYNSYQSTPLMYYEKSGSLLETFSTSGIMYSVFENVDNRTAAWITPHFECCISVPTDAMDIDMLKEILLSMQ